MLITPSNPAAPRPNRSTAHMGGFALFQIELSRGYGQAEFREDLKKVYRQVGSPPI